MVKLMADAGTLTRLDVDLLAMYCDAHERYIIAKDRLGDNYILSGEKADYHNPLLNVMNKATAQMMSLSRLMGIDKVTAKKLGVDGKPPVAAIPVRDRNQAPKDETA